MSDKQSRRNFVKTGAAALVGAGLASAAGQALAGSNQVRMEEQKVNRMTMAQSRLNRKQLAHLSNTIMASPQNRQAFLKDPRGFADHNLRSKIDTSTGHELDRLRKLVADGFCCAGCGCSSDMMRSVMPANRK